jgi:hypothetical protein
VPKAPSRRHFLTASTAAAATILLPAAEPKPPAKPVRVVVWDEQQPQQKEAYDNFLGHTIAKYLEVRQRFSFAYLFGATVLMTLAAVALGVLPV